ncbi:DUF614 domain protein [Trichophyton benhamiae CBS 112371]|uniref:DUF614 domain protein n=1 Tax=Arthroderma benhamiae (strain ATCC MYA-4681 / CBS 112371) TaxID=663331 RepID=D4AV51_ARTBC|nr:DUF614 domain protein [Trichophyton benhamiae CBS 112371]EFE32973.1 DUF614 domain protein [Trichophyton benhamiae CBS 112371]
MDPNSQHNTDPNMKSGFAVDSSSGMPTNKWGSPFYEFWDPVDTTMSGFSYFNGDCCLWLCLAYCGCFGIFQGLKRIETRKQYGIEGNEVLDFAGSCCLPCCMLVQEDKEITRRTEAAGYQRTSPMSYP